MEFLPVGYDWICRDYTNYWKFFMSDQEFNLVCASVCVTTETVECIRVRTLYWKVHNGKILYRNLIFTIILISIVAYLNSIYQSGQNFPWTCKYILFLFCCFLGVQKQRRPKFGMWISPSQHKPILCSNSDQWVEKAESRASNGTKQSLPSPDSQELL